MWSFISADGLVHMSDLISVADLKKECLLLLDKVLFVFFFLRRVPASLFVYLFAFFAFFFCVFCFSVFFFWFYFCSFFFVVFKFSLFFCFPLFVFLIFSCFSFWVSPSLSLSLSAVLLFLLFFLLLCFSAFCSTASLFPFFTVYLPFLRLLYSLLFVC